MCMMTTGSNAFQFMKDWKMPTYDPNEEAVKEKFGDKSKSTAVVRIVSMFSLFHVLYDYIKSNPFCFEKKSSIFDRIGHINGCIFWIRT